MPHIHDKYDFTASALVVYKDRVLLHMHKRAKQWLGMGGHIELDQDPEEALWMELKEEAGLTKKELSFAPICKPKFHDAEYSWQLPIPFDYYVVKYLPDMEHWHIDSLYLMISSTDKVNPAPGESQELKWFDLKELKDLKDIPEELRMKAIAALEYASKT